jgi:hypothetical protein
MSKNVKVKLTLDLEIDPAGLSNSVIGHRLNQSIAFLMDRGLITAETDMTIEGWSSHVTVKADKKPKGAKKCKKSKS